MENKIIDELQWKWVTSDEYTNSQEYKKIRVYEKKINSYIEAIAPDNTICVKIADTIGELETIYETYAFFAGFKTAVQLMNELKSCLLK